MNFMTSWGLQPVLQTCFLTKIYQVFFVEVEGCRFGPDFIGVETKEMTKWAPEMTLSTVLVSFSLKNMCIYKYKICTCLPLTMENQTLSGN